VALPASINRIGAELPFAMRKDLEGYLSSVDAARADIYLEAGINAELVPRETFLFVVAIWQLWVYIDSQRWIVENSLNLARDFDVNAIQAGGMHLSRGSEDVESIRKLHNDLRRWLNRKGLNFVIEIRDLRALLVSIAESDSYAN
jgi:hypothetical protein